MKRIAMFSFLLLYASALSACGCFDTGGEGCATDTPGVMGNVIFDFMHTNDNVSQDNGNAFSVDTQAHLKIRPMGDSEDSIPPWAIESSDESVITVDEILEGVEFPIVLSMDSPGTTELRVIDRQDQEIFDYVNLEVVEPEGMSALMAFLLLDWAPVGNSVLVPAGTGNCYLAFYPFDTVDGEERYLYGEYDMTVTGDETVFEFEHFPHAYCYENEFTTEGMWFCSNERSRGYYIVRITALSEGSKSIDFTGPRGAQASRLVTTVAVDEVEEMKMKVVPLSGTFEGKYVGEAGIIAAVQSFAGIKLCGSFPVVFESTNTDVVSLNSSGYLESNEIEFYLNAVGTAAVRATLEGNPAIQDTVTFRVLEQ